MVVICCPMVVYSKRRGERGREAESVRGRELGEAGRRGGDGGEKGRRETEDGGEESTPKIFENPQIPKKSILLNWYTQIPIAHLHGSNERPKNRSGDGLAPKIAKFHR